MADTYTQVEGVDWSGAAARRANLKPSTSLWKLWLHRKHDTFGIVM